MPQDSFFSSNHKAVDAFAQTLAVESSKARDLIKLGKIIQIHFIYCRYCLSGLVIRREKYRVST